MIKSPPIKITPRIQAAAEALSIEDGWAADSWSAPAFAHYRDGYHRRAAAVVAALDSVEQGE